MDTLATIHCTSNIRLLSKPNENSFTYSCHPIALPRDSYSATRLYAQFLDKAAGSVASFQMIVLNVIQMQNLVVGGYSCQLALTGEHASHHSQTLAGHDGRRREGAHQAAAVRAFGGVTHVYFYRLT